MLKFLRDLDLAYHRSFAVVPYAALTILFYNNDGWFHFFFASPKQDPTRDTIFDVFDIVNVQCSMFNVIGVNCCFQ